MTLSYYNEIDPQKAAWLRELIRVDVIAKGEVDERSIADIRLDDLRGFAQCHFFAGIGVWSYALRLAGWPDDRPVWTGSCPCPSFSAAGKGGGFNDPRHLWPDWARLARECKPATIFGEQADDAIGYGWLDLVQTDLERADYAVGKAVLGACSVGAPHIRQRLYFVANAARERQSFGNGEQSRKFQGEACSTELRSGDALRGLEHANLERLGEARSARSGSRPSGERASGELADANGRGLAVRRRTEAQCNGSQRSEHDGMGDTEGAASGSGFSLRARESHDRGAGYVNGFWRDADWILRKRWNRDDWEWCPTEPGTFPLAHGAAARVLRLRGYSDAICAPLAAEFIKASQEALSFARPTGHESRITKVRQ